MALLTPTSLYKAQPSDSADDILHTVTNTAGKYTVVKQIVIANVTGVAATIRLYHIETGGAVAANRAILYDYSVAPNTTVVLSLNLFMGPNETLRARQVTASALTVNISGYIN